MLWQEVLTRIPQDVFDHLQLDDTLRAGDANMGSAHVDTAGESNVNSFSCLPVDRIVEHNTNMSACGRLAATPTY